MNYIRHLNAFFNSIKQDNRLTASHVSLYLALFQYWNFNRFQNPFPIYRTDIMNLCKIGSKNTYHKCVKELHHCNYIIYHPASSKYQPVKISMIRLDKQVPKDPTQLHLFESPSPLGEGFRERCPNIDTQHVPNLTNTSPNINTSQVPNMGQLIKPNNKQVNVCNTPTEIFKRNEKIQKAVNQLAHVPKSVHSTDRHPELVSGSIPTLSEVEEFFTNHTYPLDEAKKFFLYNQGKNWMLTDKLKIKNWQALAHKWMLNTKKSDKGNHTVIATKEAISNSSTELQYLYECFLDGKKIFQHITTEHFNHLQLQLTDENIQHAWNQRTEQVSGTNQYSLNQLWQAYLNGNKKDPLIKKDTPNLISLAKRIAVINHFQHCKQRNIAVVGGRTNNPP